ncbi:MAG: SDR family NAD(P)-dependent oxidoreductase [Gammaproteobacteria bacterium]|nr:SDR family NAD(P)-dependent oxidoreductase [Gammaproteobacteria bacterium]
MAEDLPWTSAWVTGASAGIGRALALRLAAGGCAVTASARSAGALEELHDAHSAITPRPLDVTDTAAMAAAVADMEGRQGPLDLALFNAGTYDPLPGGLGDPAVFRRHMEVNYMGVVNGLHGVLPAMKERGRGQVALMGSLSGYRGLPQAAYYGPTKAALINLAETLRTELGGSGVDLRIVNPGFVATRLTEKNDFTMPDLMTAEDAATAIITGLRGTGFEIAFPRRFALVMKLARLLPYGLFFPLAARLAKE